MNEGTKGAWRVGSLVLQNGIWLNSGSGAPTSGTSGTLAGQAAPGSYYFDYTNGATYQNMGTLASPTWTVISGVADGAVRFAEVALTSAELKALRATVKELVAAPGTGDMLEFISIVLLYDAGATGYTNGTGDFVVRYKDATGDIISQVIASTGFISATADIMQFASPVATDNKTTKADCENQPLVLHNNGAAEWTGGDGVVRAKIAYRRWSTGW